MTLGRFRGALILAALISSVPSAQALHPAKARSDLNDDDLTGSGRETDSVDRCFGARRDDALRTKVVRQWRDMAERVRRQALLMDIDERQEFLARAERYEEWARRLEKET
jgi:hypothetical protein